MKCRGDHIFKASSLDGRCTACLSAHPSPCPLSRENWIRNLDCFAQKNRKMFGLRKCPELKAFVYKRPTKNISLEAEIFYWTGSLIADDVVRGELLLSADLPLQGGLVQHDLRVAVRQQLQSVGLGKLRHVFRHDAAGAEIHLKFTGLISYVDERASFCLQRHCIGLWECSKSPAWSGHGRVMVNIWQQCEVSSNQS